MIVADASAIGTFILPDEGGPFSSFARTVCLDHQLHVPAHWHVEVGSLIRKAMRRGRLVDADLRNAVAAAMILAGTSVTAPPIAIDLAVAASERFGLTVYDAVYLLLAQSLGIPLLTDDGALRRAAIAQGVDVLLP